MKNISRLVSCVVILSLVYVNAGADPVGNNYTANGSKVTGAGSNASTAYFLDTNPTTYSVTVAAGSNLGNTTGQGNGNEIEFNNGSVANYGTLNASNGDGITMYGNASIANAGSITGIDAIYIDNEASGGTTSSSLSNSGSLTSTQDAAVYIYQGNIGGAGINSNTVTIFNSGSIQANDDNGIRLDFLYNGDGTGTGVSTNAVTVTNSGKISSEDNGIYLSGQNYDNNGTGSNVISVTNSGPINSSDSDGIEITNFGNADNAGLGINSNTVTLQNTGEITSEEEAIYLDLYNNDNSGNGTNTVTVSNAAAITSYDSYGIDMEVGNDENMGTGTDTNTVTMTNSGAITSEEEAIFVNLDNGQSSGNGTNTLTLTNSSALNSEDNNGIAVLIENEGNSGTGTDSNMVTIKNSGEIDTYFGGIVTVADNEQGSGNGTNIISVTNTAEINTQLASGIDLEAENSYEAGTAASSNTITIVNSGVITANIEGIEVDEMENEHDGGVGTNTLTITNSGTITTAMVAGMHFDVIENAYNHGDGMNTNTVTISNSAPITANEDTGIFVDTENSHNTGNGSNSMTLSLSASSAITAADDGVDVEALNQHNHGAGTDSTTVTLTNNGSITSQYSKGVVVAIENTRSAGNASNDITFLNTGSIQASNAGVYLHTDEDHIGGTYADSISFSNYGTITSTNNDGVDLENDTNAIYGMSSSANIQVLNTGSITSNDGDGLYVYNERHNGTATVTNYGNISGTYDGVELDSRNATFTTYGGSISGGNNAIELDHNDSSVTVVGRSNMQGTIEGNGHSANTLTFHLAGVSAAQAAAAQNAINAAAGGPGSFTAAGLTYNFDGFTAANTNLQTVSFGSSVDPGLRDLGNKLDNTTIALPESMDALYTEGFFNPEAALNSLSGREFLDAFSQIGLSNATQFGATADNRANALRAGSSGLDFSGLSLSPNTMIASLGNMENTLNHMSSSIFGGTTMSDSVDHKAMISDETARWGVWAAGTVTFADESSTATAPGYNAVSGSPTFGIDYRVCPDVVVGALFNYTKGDVNFADGSTLDTESYLGGVYVDWAHKGFFVNGLVAGGETSYGQNRNTLGGGTAYGGPSGTEVLATVSGGYDFKFSGFVVSPEAGLQYTYLEKDAFNESGAGAFDLNVGEQDVNSLRTKLGVNFSRPIDCSGTKIVPQINSFWYHECLDNSNGVTNSLPGAPGVGSFVVNTNPESRDFALVGAGVTATPHAFNGNLSLFVSMRPT